MTIPGARSKLPPAADAVTPYSGRKERRRASIALATATADGRRGSRDAASMRRD
jgi:hypothetical protein